MKKLLYLLLFVPLLVIISCENEIEGCTDSIAVNYNYEATINNNSCLFDSDEDGDDSSEGGEVFEFDPPSDISEKWNTSD